MQLSRTDSLHTFCMLLTWGPLSRASVPRSDPETHQYWVQKVKDAHRLSPDLKQKWWEHCDKQSGGFRDPHRHSVKSIQTFFEFYAADYGNLPPAADSQKNDEGAALAALSPTVTAITFNGQRAYVVEFASPVQPQACFAMAPAPMGVQQVFFNSLPMSQMANQAYQPGRLFVSARGRLQQKGEKT
ncbi:unnamed protein product [Effrenium voratum]|uniref:Uncharacterized protein n=1 Tax=Effrenium voratum TaxID=2562239 RepID=A0AA36MTD8_9DINO|nr:unnamed protein product [Effrenium voratum]